MRTLWGSEVGKMLIMYGYHSPFYTQNWPLMCEFKILKVVLRLNLKKEPPHLDKHWSSYNVLKFGPNSLKTKNDL